MPSFHYVRVGALGHVGRFEAVDAGRHPRGARVVVRTARGLELGQVLTPPNGDEPGEADGTLLRRVAVEDDLLAERLSRNRDAALAACSDRLAEAGVPAMLVDVEHLFDGRTLVFYFMGDLPAEVASLLDELAETYETKAQVRNFAEVLTQGCGPGCGTDSAAGQGCTSCVTGCAVAGTCSTRKQ